MRKIKLTQIVLQQLLKAIVRVGLFLPQSALLLTCCSAIILQPRNGFKIVMIKTDNLCSSVMPFYKQTLRSFHKHI